MIIESTLKDIWNEKIKNTIIAFTEDLVNEVKVADEEGVQGFEEGQNGGF